MDILRQPCSSTVTHTNLSPSKIPPEELWPGIRSFIWKNVFFQLPDTFLAPNIMHLGQSLWYAVAELTKTMILLSTDFNILDTGVYLVVLLKYIHYILVKNVLYITATWWTRGE